MTIILGVVTALVSPWALPQGDAPRFPGIPEQDALEYRLELDVDLTAREVSGRVRYRMRAVKPLREVRLHAKRSNSWKIEFHTPHGPLAAKWDERGVVVSLRGQIDAGAEFGFGADIEGTPPDGFYFKNNRYGDPLAFTDHYSIRARGWLPCEDHPGDRAKFVTTLTFPKGNEALISGAMSEVIGTRGGRLVISAETKSDIPPYMYAIVVGPYAKVTEAGDSRLVPHLVYSRDVEKAKASLVHHAKWIKIMEQTFGPYPYAKYTTVQCPTRWGGFEAPGNVQLHERLYDRGAAGVGTLAHELVHMWFGDAVGYSEWREVWLSEGFASYFGPWLHGKTGGPTFRDSLSGMRTRWRRSAESRRKTIRDASFPHPDQALNANTYPKGAWVLHMLRGELGDQLFFKSLQDYFVKHTGSSVVTTEFVASIEKSTDRELDWFFSQWLDRRDCPQLALSVEDGKLIVEQKQPNGAYRFRLPLAWRGKDGKRAKRYVRVTERRTVIDLEGGKPESVEIDPDVELLYRLVK